MKMCMESNSLDVHCINVEYSVHSMYPYYSCLCTFWCCHPYFSLQSAIVLTDVTTPFFLKRCGLNVLSTWLSLVDNYRGSVASSWAAFSNTRVIVKKPLEVGLELSFVGTVSILCAGLACATGFILLLNFKAYLLYHFTPLYMRKVHVLSFYDRINYPI